MAKNANNFSFVAGLRPAGPERAEERTESQELEQLLKMSDDAWANFIASINPAQLEQERMRVHGDLDHERPGSREDHEMRFAHDWLKQQRIRDATDDDTPPR